MCATIQSGYGEAYVTMTGAKRKRSIRQGNSLQFVANGLAASGIERVADKAERDKFIQDCLVKYHTPGTTRVERRELVDHVLYNVWFLLPYVAASKKFAEPLFEETLQNMSLAVMRAIKRYDPHRGTRFVTYLTGWLKEAICISALDSCTVKPASKVPKAKIIAQVAENSRFRSQPLRPDEPYNEELFMDMDTEMYFECLPEEALDDVQHEQENVERRVCNQEIYAIVQQAIEDEDILTDKERIVILNRFGVFGVPHKTLETTAEFFQSRGWGATKEWIHQIEKKALAKIRRYLKRNGIYAEDAIYFD